MRREAPLGLWLAVSANAIAGGALIGWSLANMPVESLGVGGWLRSLALCGRRVAGAAGVERGGDARGAAAAVLAADRAGG